MRVVIIRHGQTKWNVEKRVQGHTDVELNAVGLEQALMTGERLSQESVDIIYTSDMIRAKKTAEIINAHHGVKIIESPALREIGFGIFEGRIREEASAEMEYYRSLGQPYPGSEDVTDYFPRVHNFLDEIIGKGHENIFIVSHFGAIRAMICYFLKLPAERRTDFTIGNAAIYVFEGSAASGFSLITENDYAHII